MRQDNTTQALIDKGNKWGGSIERKPEACLKKPDGEE